MLRYLVEKLRKLVKKKARRNISKRVDGKKLKYRYYLLGIDPDKRMYFQLLKLFRELNTPRQGTYIYIKREGLETSGLILIPKLLH